MPHSDLIMNGKFLIKNLIYGLIALKKKILWKWHCLKKINDILKSGISASTLNLFIKNPYLFFEQKILGIDDEMGSLEKGKDATLFISKGDALDMKTNIISRNFDGRDMQ